MKKNVLVTGASGFIGSFLVEGGLERDMEVWAGMRSTSSRKYLNDKRINFIELNFADQKVLQQQLVDHRNKCGKWDYVIHCAGVTKCIDKNDFERGNYEATRHLIEALMAADMMPARFIYLSSLSIYGPVRETDYTDIEPTDTPCPNTAYGVSKLKTEAYLKSIKDFPYVIFRPTGVYGPREKDYFLMAASIKQHVDFAAGYKRQDITFVYVKDLVQAIYAAIEKEVYQRAYFLTDGKVYNSRHFSDLIRRELGNPWLLRIVCPLCLLKAISYVAEKVSHLTHKPSTLNSDKYNIMKQRNWRCNIRPAIEELDYRPQYQLERGVKEIINWYKQEKWL